uniref:Ig-like domain-containing protein n=1 Tax=Panthera leo TaxID=9689 RepID=A0A8C8XRC5_PANLE
MSGLFRAAVGGRQEVAPPAWVPTSGPEGTGPPLQELGASLPQELHLFVSLELFPSPVLTASPSWPIEGSPVTLTCETWLPPLTSHTRLQFCFFKEHRALGAGWSNSPELQIPTMWSEGAASYWCQARTVIPRILKTSPRSQIRVHRVPVSDVNLETQPPVGQLIEGEDLVLICSVAAGTGTVTFSWHREGSERSLGRKTQNALSAELRIASVREQDAGRYYCAADNLDGPVLSKRIRITPRVPVSHPVLTLNPDVAQAMVGDVLELRCEAQRGSPPILYWFYHEDVILGNTSAPFGGGASFNLSLTTEHSGNYSCGADNGLGAQSSETVSLNITGGLGVAGLQVTVKVKKIFFPIDCTNSTSIKEFLNMHTRLGTSRDWC